MSDAPTHVPIPPDGIHEYFSTRFVPSWRYGMRFELKSWLGRHRFSRGEPPLRADQDNLLHLGCGMQRLPGFVNADFFAHHGGTRLDWELDLRFPFRCPDAAWSGVFSEHALEHLYPEDARNMLRECFRTMRSGAWLRLCVPDLRKYVAYYTGELEHEVFSALWPTGCEAMRALTQNWFHVSLWDAQFLGQVLAQIGFTDTQERSFGMGADPRLLVDTPNRAWESLYFEARKP